MTKRAAAIPTLVLLILLVGLVGSPVGPTFTGAIAGIPVGPLAAPSPGPSPHPAAAPPRVTPAVVHPFITCPPPPPPNPVYASIGGLFPPTPKMSNQGPCPIISVDEIHATFFSNSPYSAEKFRIPVYLPKNGNNWAQSMGGQEFYVGLIVGGDPASEWGQSYAEVTFTPSGTSFNVHVAVWSLINSSHYGGSTSDGLPHCPTVKGIMPGTRANWLSYNNSFYCLVEELENGTSIGSAIPANSWLNVTFDGLKGGSGGLEVWVNDSKSSTYNTNFTFNNHLTGNHSFQPFYNSSCLDACVLHWSFPFGLGLGTFPIVYNESVYRDLPPTSFGSPEFWSGTAYSSDFMYFAPESGSGVCNTIVATGTVANCVDFIGNTANPSLPSGTGYYPYYTFNGTELDYGANWSYTTVNFGGPTFEFYSTALQHDLIPLFFYQVTNTSRAGFIAPNTAATVNATVQDLGTVSSVSLSYSVNGGTTTTVAMSLASGTATNGTYTAQIPASTTNGLINYTLTAVNHAGAQVLFPSNGVLHIRRGPFPTFHVQVNTNLLSCGRIQFNGTNYANGSSIPTLPGFYKIFAVGCYPWNFTTWTPTGGLAVKPFWSYRTAQLEVFADGTLFAHWSYVRPYDNITLAVSPSTCAASVTVGNQTRTSGGYVYTLDGLPTSIGYAGCGGDLFAGWTFVGNFTILGPVLTPHGNGTLTANFVSQTGALGIIFDTQPATCGGILFRGAGYTNGESIAVDAGTYAIAPDPCAHYGLLNWTTTSGLTISGGTITISAAGTITEINFHLTEVAFVISPPSCGYALFDGKPYRNGDILPVANNSMHSVYGVNFTGCYLIAITGTGGVHLAGNVATVNGSGQVEIAFARGSPSQIIAFLTSPSNCGTILFDNKPYTNSNFTKVAQGISVTITPQACGGYGFVRWLTYGNISIVGNTAWLNSSGAIEAVFEPLVQLYLATQPVGCGAIVLNGVRYSNVTLTLPELNTYTLRAVGCTGYAFSAWVNTSGAQINGNILNLVSGGFLTAVFVPVQYAVAILIHPAICGLVKVKGAQLGNGSVLSLTAGTYPIQAVPCLGDHLDHWTATGGLNVSGNQLSVNGSGSLNAYYLPVPPALSISVPTSSLAGEAVQLVATVAVLVPPFNYNYTWSFGDGSPTLTTPANFTSHTYSRTGTYHVLVTVRDPVNRTATASGTISVVQQSGTQVVTFTPVAITALGLVGIALVVIALLALWRRKAPPEDGSGPPANTRETSDAIPSSEMEPKP